MPFIEDFDYELPEELIAQNPAEPRDRSRMMVLDRESGTIDHRNFFDLEGELSEGDVLVMNDTKVFKARLFGVIEGRGISVEVVLLRLVSFSSHEGGSRWQAIVKKARRLKPGSVIDFDGLKAKVISRDIPGGTVQLELDRDLDGVLAFAEARGEVPLPPYIHRTLDDLDDYQTVYAREVGSVAAPTAGLHFTPDLIERLKQKGVQIEHVTLHVGLGTFQPVWEDQSLDDHEMHAEFVQISTETAGRINKAKAEGRRVIAVGTTTTRALEGSGVPEGGFAGDVDIFIKPGFEFKIIDGLITNFHLPRTTLLVLVSAFAGEALVKRAYQEAIDRKYRFYSFGDAVLIT